MLDIPLVGRAGGAHESLADVAYRVIADRVIMLGIRPNESVNESQLSKEMQMGRTPIREALRRLESDHLIVSHPRKGAFAAPIDITDLMEIAQVRQSLEPVAAGMAAKAAGAEAARTFEHYSGLIRTLETATVDQGDLMRLDLAVHQLIYRAAGNRHLEEILVRYANLSTRIWCLILERRPLVIKHILELDGLIGAILAKDAERAAELMANHVRSFNAFVTGTL
ncbi:GntR family transcriptional regulator [Specibacter cremeus]|uniref:GntR family transcriptional regulator n=1 Tax=Specibacter cremeus TaxID=1629051 RepID=UPI000F7723B3|nr:GntR family transcriptional regulator [Specibacter cremeus]